MAIDADVPKLPKPIYSVMAKITLEISDPLLQEADRLAAEERTTLQALVEQALRSTLIDGTLRARSFRLREASFGGNGLNLEMEGNWDRIRDLSYGDSDC